MTKKASYDTRPRPRPRPAQTRNGPRPRAITDDELEMLFVDDKPRRKAKKVRGSDAMKALSTAAGRVCRAFFMSLGMFSAIPCPYRPWDEDARGMMLATLPIVGAVIGLLWAVAGLLSQVFLPQGLRAAVIAALPFVLTGFIHLDGFMDTSDALLSWRPLEKRLEILKDSHTGAYAVVNLAILMLFTFGAAQGSVDVRALALVPVISRCGSALSVLCLRPIGHSEYAQLEGNTAQRIAVIAIWCVTMLAGVLWLGPVALALAVETLAYAAAMLWAAGTLKGVSGDLAGFALTISETAALVALSILGGIK